MGGEMPVVRGKGSFARSPHHVRRDRVDRSIGLSASGGMQGCTYRQGHETRRGSPARSG